MSYSIYSISTNNIDRYSNNTDLSNSIINGQFIVNNSTNKIIHFYDLNQPLQNGSYVDILLPENSNTFGTTSDNIFTGNNGTYFTKNGVTLDWSHYNIFNRNDNIYILKYVKTIPNFFQELINLGRVYNPITNYYYPIQKIVNRINSSIQTQLDYTINLIPDPIPNITSLDVSLVSALGEQTIIITGTNLDSIYNPIVKIDGLSVYSSSISSTQISFNSPIHITGNSSITVVNYFGTSNELSINFVVSNICFPAGTPIHLDQGLVPIEQINPKIHTIRNREIITVTKTITQDKYLVCIEKDVLYKNVPSEKTLISKNHKLLYNGSMIPANDLLKLDYEGIYKVKYSGEVLYNILLDKHDKMIVNNLICETLDPENCMAKMYYHLKKSNYNFEQEQKFIKDYNKYVIQNKTFSN